MITYFISFAAGTCGYAVAHFAAGIGNGWSVAIGFAVLLAAQIGMTWHFMKKLKVEMGGVQSIMAEGQKSIQAKVARWQIRPPGSIAEAQRIIFEDTCSFVKRAIAEADKLKKYRLWVPMIDRQVATAKLQLNWMIKNFKEVDALMPRAIMLDPVSVSMKMARLYMLDKPIDDIAKVYEKCSRRLRYNENALLAGCYSWILVKRGDLDGAFKALTAALKKSDNETLKKNHQCLMNNRPAQFNNSGLGDQWYALHLEEPKMRARQQRSVFR